MKQTGNIVDAKAQQFPVVTNDATILIVDDDPGMRRILHRVLRSAGFHCLIAANGQEMRERLYASDVDLVLLDVMMPGESGFDLCQSLRDRDEDPVPVIMISARGDPGDQAIGLELGADDYIAKPFSETELLARVRALLRRSRISVSHAQRPRSRQWRFAGWTVDLGRRNLATPTGARVELSGAEFDLLLALMDHSQRVVGRDILVESARARLGSATDRTIDVHICRLRRKLGDEETRTLIRTVRGFGYIFTEAVERS